jgi:hypothetical protein
MCLAGFVVVVVVRRRAGGRDVLRKGCGGLAGEARLKWDWCRALERGSVGGSEWTAW